MDKSAVYDELKLNRIISVFFDWIINGLYGFKYFKNNI